MHLEGSVNIKASRETVWQFLTDAQKVSQCAPGVESVEIVEKDSDRDFWLTAQEAVDYKLVNRVLTARSQLEEL